MRIDHIKITKLYGSISKSVNFRASLNLLVGINGSGKTSILNVIDWLLRPNMPRLALTTFDELRLTLTHKARATIIAASKKENALTLSIQSGNKQFHPLRVSLAGGEDLKATSLDEDQMFEWYTRLRPEKEEEATWEFFKSLPSPIVISLDRTISAEEESTYYRDADVRTSSRRKAQIESPLVRVEEVTTTRFAQYRSEVIEYNNKLKNKIILSAFDDAGVRGHKLPKTQPLVSLNEINALERKVLNQLSLDAPATKTIKTYFRRLKGFLAQIKKPSDENIYSKYFAERFRMIDDLAKAFKDFETKSTQAFSHLGTYLDTVNSFLKDSSKHITFN